MPLSLATSLTSAGTAWATIPMGAPSGPNQFWQLFTLASPGGRWSLKTPGGVATNGALVLAGPGRQTLTAGIRPSLDLGFSPVTTTRDGGGTWSSLPPDPGFADVPDALAATAGGRLIALGLHQAVQVAGPQQAAWTTLTTREGPRRDSRGPALRAGRAHRGRLHPGRVAAAGRDLRPGGHRRHLRPEGRDVAAGRPGPARRAERPAGAGHPAEPGRRP